MGGESSSFLLSSLYPPPVLDKVLSMCWARRKYHRVLFGHTISVVGSCRKIRGRKHYTTRATEAYVRCEQWHHHAFLVL